MAKPGVAYSDLLTAVHTAPVGSKFQGFTLASRTEIRDGQWRLEVTKAGNTWRVDYIAGSELGKIMDVYDDDDRSWAPAPWLNDWLDNGIQTVTGA